MPCLRLVTEIFRLRECHNFCSLLELTTAERYSKLSKKDIVISSIVTAWRGHSEYSWLLERFNVSKSGCIVTDTQDLLYSVTNYSLQDSIQTQRAPLCLFPSWNQPCCVTEYSIIQKTSRDVLTVVFRWQHINIYLSYW